MDASERGRLLSKLADLVERDSVYLAVRKPNIKNSHLGYNMYNVNEQVLFIFYISAPLGQLFITTL